MQCINLIVKFDISRRGIPAQPISTGFCEYLNIVDNNNNNGYSSILFNNRPNILPTTKSIDIMDEKKLLSMPKPYENDSVSNANRIFDNNINGKGNDSNNNKITSTLSSLLSSSSSSMHQTERADIKHEIEPRIALMSKNNGIIHKNKHSVGGFMYSYLHNGAINGFGRYNVLLLIIIYTIWFN